MSRLTTTHQPSTPDTRAVKGISSDVLLDYGRHEAIKRYRRNPLIGALYRAAFQAPFPYVSNIAALKAAKHRRRIAGLVTRYFLGRDVVAPVKRVERDGDGYLFVTELVDGREPKDHRRARAFLHEVTQAFIESGLPTWQVSPHNPRSLGNLLETPDGDYRVIDLESNVVTPMVPLSEVWGAARTGHLPPFDDIDIPRLVRFVDENWEGLVEHLGEEDAHLLARSVARYAWYENLWQKNEPRVWSRALGRAVRFVDAPRHIRRLWRAVERRVASGTELAERWVDRGIARWEAEAVITSQQAAQARADLQSAPIVAVMAHLGGQFAISIPLRFPLGSAARLLWSATFRLRAELRALFRRAAPEETRTARGIHSLPVIAVSAVPGIGAAAYVLATPLRRNGVLLGAALDQGFRLLPLRLYERFHLRPVTIDVARRYGATPLTFRERLGLLADGLRALASRPLLVTVLAANALALAGAAAYMAAAGEAAPFEQNGLIGILMIAEAIGAGLIGIAYYRHFWSEPGGDERAGAAGTLFWLGGGLALVFLAAGQFLGFHEWIAAELDERPLLEGSLALLFAGYLVCAVIWIRLFGHELERDPATLALMTLAVIFAGVAVGAELFVPGGSDWAAVGRAGQLAAVGCVLPAFVAKYQTLAQERRTG